MAITICIDSIFWGRIIWPEFSVLYFNTVLNKSKDWGVMPYWWYFYSALPRAMSATLVLVPIAFKFDPEPYAPNITRILVPTVVFILLYSLLPHKELRFIIYTLPLLNTAAAVAFVGLWNRVCSPLQKLATRVCLVGIVVVTIFTTVNLTMISRLNYPGGEAFERLHHICRQPGAQCHSDGTNVTKVHISVPPAQTGVSRFGEDVTDAFAYSKVEAWSATNKPSKFDWLLTGEDGPEKYNTHTVGFTVMGFHRVKLSLEYPFIKFVVTPKIYGLRRQLYCSDPAKCTKGVSTPATPTPGRS